MAKRLTDSEKWKDAWFIELTNESKLLFYFLIDNVDNAGFYEVSFRKMEFDLQFNRDKLLGAIKGLGRGLLGAEYEIKNGDKLYLKNFLKHQKMLPLNPFNSFHSNALKSFNDNILFVEKHSFLSDMQVKGTKIRNKKTISKIEETLLKYLKNNQGLASPIVEVEVKVKEEVNNLKVVFEKIIKPYDFLKKNEQEKLQVFEMQNKSSFSDYNIFVENFNSKVIEEELEFKPKILMARLNRLNTNWNKKPKEFETTTFSTNR